MGAEKRKNRRGGFTLIALSIVLVIIGLITGGILTGQILIASATVRAQVTQIEKYNTAAATFQGKYGYLPGDIIANAAAQFGFISRAGVAGRGDGNGELDGPNGGGIYSYDQGGENLFFWEDLYSAQLIEGKFTSWVDNANAMGCTSFTACSVYFPSAKIGGSNVIYAYSGYAANCPGGGTCNAYIGIGPNFFGLAIINAVSGGNVSDGGIPPAPGLAVSQAYAIDKKMDDGMPTTGKVLAQYLTAVAGHPGWSANSTTDSAATCYNSATNAYSVNIRNGNNINCGLSFQFQAGN